MIYLIGGPARCGKSTLAKRLRKEVDGQILSGDALTHALQDGFLQPEWLPDLFEHIIDPLKTKTTPEGKIERLRRRDLVMWRFYEGYFESASHGSDDDILLEGNVWPDSLTSFSLPHKAVFLVDTSPDQAERLIEIRNGNEPNNWMKYHDYTDEQIKEWAIFNAARSRYYVKMCREYGYEFFDVAEHGIDGAQQHAFEYLLEKTV